MSGKKIGRPATGVGTPVLVRLSNDELLLLDAFRRGYADIPTRPEALRRLMADVVGQIRRCKHCGEAFVAGGIRRADAEFCSKEHKVRYFSLKRSSTPVVSGGFVCG